VLNVQNGLEHKKRSIAIISVFANHTGTSTIVLNYRKALVDLGYTVITYQLKLPENSNKYIESNFYIEGKKFLIKALELPFNLLFVLPKTIPEITEDIVVLTDPAMLKLKLRFPNSITIFHDLRELSEFNHNPLRKLFYRHILNYVNENDKILALSQFTEDTIKSILKTNLEIRVVEGCSHFNTNVSAVYEKISAIRVGKSEINVLYIAADRPYKNLKLFINVAKKLSKLPLSVKFHFILVSKLRNSTNRLVKHEQLDNLEIIDHVDNLYNIYNKTHILLFPSLIEGFGLPLAEAMSFGIPIIYSNRPPMIDIVGKYGISIDPYQVDLWVKELINLSDSNTYEKMALLALERSKRFSYDKFKENLASALKSFNDLH
jgi:glycosyltransferase involved in cell wall biosynthesis